MLIPIGQALGPPPHPPPPQTAVKSRTKVEELMIYARTMLPAQPSIPDTRNTILAGTTCVYLKAETRFQEYKEHNK